MSRSHRARKPWSRRRRIAVGAGGLGLVLLVLGLLALPLLGVPGRAVATKDALLSAVEHVRTGDAASAEDAVAEARANVDDAQEGVDGWGVDLWSVLPVVGTAVDDARHLVQALDDATAVAEVGTRLMPSVTGDQATLFRAGTVDRETLDEVVAGVDEAVSRLESADRALAKVEGSTPVVGATITARRDEAASQLGPALESARRYAPLLDEAPALVGFGGDRTYLVALLNPAEQRYSGGAALAFVRMRWSDGELSVGAPVTPLDDVDLSTPMRWPGVEGNPFHLRKTFAVNSTFAPSWSVSGRELLTVWRKARGTFNAGLLAVDTVALAQLLGTTGPLQVPGVGRVTQDNLVETLVGSYDDYYPDATAQDAQNEALLPVFVSQLLDGGNLVAKVQAVRYAAAGRHLAFYARDEALAEATTALDLTGDLGPGDADYVGFFTQNTNIAKSDYYQRRATMLTVDLAADGSSRNRLDVELHNDTPPYVGVGEDPRTGYFTRWSAVSAGVFLPDGARLGEVRAGGERLDVGGLDDFYGHDYFETRLELAPQERERIRVEYEVPSAAEVSDDGTLEYRLAFDPQGTVQDGTMSVRLRLPEGTEVAEAPEGWTVEGRTVTMPAAVLATSSEWTVVARRA